MVPHDDLLHPDIIASPHAYFHDLRATDPVHWNDRWGGWVLTAYDDVLAAFKDPRFASDRITPYLERQSPEARAAVDPIFRILGRWMVFRDPPDHTRLRNLVSKAFTPGMIAGLEPRIRAIVDELLDAVEGHDEIDLVREVAYPLPVTVIAEMLGTPPEDRELVKQWSDDIAGVVFGAMDAPDRFQRGAAGMGAFAEYLGEIIAARRQAPRADLVSQLIAARDQRDALSEEEVVSTCNLLLFAGHETTTGLIANGTWLLLTHSAELERLRAQPALLAPAVEEMLRCEGPAKAAMRKLTGDVALRGKHLRAGDDALLVQGAANRDPAQFPEPDRFDVGRAPNPHLGFGHGIHYCLGAPLARLEARILFERLLARFPNLHWEPHEIAWGRTIIGRGFGSLRVRL